MITTGHLAPNWMEYLPYDAYAVAVYCTAAISKLGSVTRVSGPFGSQDEVTLIPSLAGKLQCAHIQR
jgi:hypothetical protein